MSATLAGGSSRVQKATCTKCNRTVHVAVIDGERVLTDPELMSVVPFERGKPEKILARRSHNEMCMRYQSDAAKKKAIASARPKADPK